MVIIVGGVGVREAGTRGGRQEEVFLAKVRGVYFSKPRKYG